MQGKSLPDLAVYLKMIEAGKNAIAVQNVSGCAVVTSSGDSWALPVWVGKAWSGNKRLCLVNTLKQNSDMHGAQFAHKGEIRKNVLYFTVLYYILVLYSTI